MMEHRKLIAALKQLKVETGRLACLGCGYEHNCGIHGCAIIREAVEALEERPSEPVPLTADQLRKLVGKWVRIDLLDAEEKTETMAYIGGDGIHTFLGYDCDKWTVKCRYEFDDCGKHFFAYACNPAYIDAKEPKHSTLSRADLVRRMSDEELARKITRLMEGELVLPYCRELSACDDDLERDQLIPLERCEACVLHWLQQPAKEDKL